jgi:hypothetical protein
MPTLPNLNPLPTNLKLLPLILTIIGTFISILRIYTKTSPSSLINYPINSHASCLIWFLVPSSTQFQLKPYIYIRHHLTKTLDQGWFETLSGQGINLTLSKTRTLAHFMSPKSPTHTLLISLSIIAIILSISTLC